MIQLPDHILVAVLVMLYPLYSWHGVRKAERELAATDASPYDTIQDYQRTIGGLALLAILCLANWLYQGRDIDMLGLGAGATPLRWTGGTLLALLGLSLTWINAMKVDRDPAARDDVRTRMEKIAFLMPQTARELRWFKGVALTAGLCEELLYRGFMIWYLQNWIGVIPALLVSSLLFGLAHAYQGITNLPHVAFIGLWCGGIFLLTGSLWLAMATHFVFDVIGGRMIYESFKTEPVAG